MEIQATDMGQARAVELSLQWARLVASREGVYGEELRELDEEIENFRPEYLQTRIWGQDQQPEWASGLIWDCQDPKKCIPMQRSTAARPVSHGTSDAFFREQGKLMEWPEIERCCDSCPRDAGSREMATARW